MDASPDTEDGRLARNWQLAGRFLWDVAHDVNNHLGAAMVHAELLESSGRDPQHVRESTREIVAAVERASYALDSLASIVGRDEASAQQVDLAEMVRDTVALFRRERDRIGVSMTVTGADKQATVCGVQTCLARLLFHVLSCAIQAAGAPDSSRQIRVAFQSAPDGYVLLVSVPGADLNSNDLESLDEAKRYAHQHRGRLIVDVDVLTVALPRDTGFTAG